MLFPTLYHPSRYIWDFWYYYDPKDKLFHVFYLNADPVLVPDEKHHWASQVGYGITKDFTSMDWGPVDILTASPLRWDNSSIWTGDVVRISNGFLLFYTSRNSETDDGKTQNIGVAYANRIGAPKWQPIPNIQLSPDGLIYSARHIPNDVTIHAWRDPFVFRHDNQIYMVVTAKSIKRPIGNNGVVALLHSADGSYKNWEYLKPITNPGFYSEMEVTQILQNPKSGFELVFSTGPKYDKSPGTKGSGGLYGISSANALSFKNNPQLLLPFDSGLYACRIIPELDGEIVGFDHRTGGIRRSGIKTAYKSLDRDFSDWTL